MTNNFSQWRKTNAYAEANNPTHMPDYSKLHPRSSFPFTSCCEVGNGSCHGDTSSCSLTVSEFDSAKEGPWSSGVVAMATVVGVAVPRLVGGLMFKKSSSQVSVQATSRILSNASWDSTDGGRADEDGSDRGTTTL